MVAYAISVALSWLSLAYLVLIHTSRIVEGQSLGVFGVMISIGGFCISVPFYVVGVRPGINRYCHFAYWIPIFLAVAMGVFLKVTFAP